MRIIPFRILKNVPEAFRFQIDELPRLYDYLHQHPEIQITAIISSEGTLLAGDYIGRFKPGDIFLIGSNLPHVFRNDMEFGNDARVAKTISVYFDESMLGSSFWHLPETRDLFQFLKNPQQAYQIKGDKSETIKKELFAIQHAEGIKRIISFLQMISHFETETDMQVLSGSVSKRKLNAYDQERINKVLEFTFSDFHRAINLEEVAAIANLSTVAFCRYFKTRTGKSYISFLSELRVQHAKKLLSESKSSIMDIAFQSGFNNLSHFNRIFRKLTGHTPSAIRAEGYFGLSY